MTGCAGVASVAGETSDGALGDAGFTVNVAVRVTPPETAEIVADVEAVTDVVGMVKLAVAEPPGTVTLAGTLVALELSESDTITPPLGAAALKVTVPVEELPPTTLVGLTATAESVGAGAGRFTLIAENWNTLSSAAESWTVVLSTGNVVTVNVALVAPPGMVTLLGTLAESGRLLPRLIATPTGGAGPASVTVPVEGLPPTTPVGLTVKEVSAGRLGYRVRECDKLTPPPETQIVTTVGAETGAVVMSKKPMPLTAATVMVPGTAASAGSLLATRMT